MTIRDLDENDLKLWKEEEAKAFPNTINFIQIQSRSHILSCIKVRIIFLTISHFNILNLKFF